MRTTEAVRALIETWVGLLVEKRFGEALAMLATPRPLLDPPATEAGWTPEVTATFDIVDLENGLALALDDVHVM